MLWASSLQQNIQIPRFPYAFVLIIQFNYFLWKPVRYCVKNVTACELYIPLVANVFNTKVNILFFHAKKFKTKDSWMHFNVVFPLSETSPCFLSHMLYVLLMFYIFIFLKYCYLRNMIFIFLQTVGTFHYTWNCKEVFVEWKVCICFKCRNILINLVRIYIYTLYYIWFFTGYPVSRWLSLSKLKTL